MHFFALYQQMQAMQECVQQFFNEINDLAVTLTAERFEKTFKIKHLGHLVQVMHEHAGARPSALLTKCNEKDPRPDSAHLIEHRRKQRQSESFVRSAGSQQNLPRPKVAPSRSIGAEHQCFQFAH